MNKEEIREHDFPLRYCELLSIALHKRAMT